MALEFAGTARHCRGDVVSGALTFPSDLADRVTNAGAGLLVLFSCQLTKSPRRIGHSLAKLRAQPWDEPHRQPRANHRACKQSDDEAVVSMSLRGWFIHVRVLPCVPYAGSE